VGIDFVLPVLVQLNLNTHNRLSWIQQLLHSECQQTKTDQRQHPRAEIDRVAYTGPSSHWKPVESGGPTGCGALPSEQVQLIKFTPSHVEESLTLSSSSSSGCVYIFWITQL
jgi:hypothetical protein